MISNIIIICLYLFVSYLTYSVMIANGADDGEMPMWFIYLTAFLWPLSYLMLFILSLLPGDES